MSQGFERSLEALERALALQPTYVQAHAGGRRELAGL
jgi:hypothetical protein